jgi:hypothetical protein
MSALASIPPPQTAICHGRPEISALQTSQSRGRCGLDGGIRARNGCWYDKGGTSSCSCSMAARENGKHESQPAENLEIKRNPRFFSRLTAFEAARILYRLGADVRVFDPTGLPMQPRTAWDRHCGVQEQECVVPTWS